MESRLYFSARNCYLESLLSLQTQIFQDHRLVLKKIVCDNRTGGKRAAGEWRTTYLDHNQYADRDALARRMAIKSHNCTQKKGLLLHFLLMLHVRKKFTLLYNRAEPTTFPNNYDVFSS